MTLITKQDIERLILPSEGPHISIYLPMERMARDTRENPIRLKNAMTEAETSLSSWGLGPRQIDDMLAPLRELLHDDTFWQQQSIGLAILRNAQDLHLYRMPLQFEEHTVIDQRYHIRPLLEPLSANGRFLVMALTQDEIRLLEGTRHLLEQLDLENVPESLAEALKWDDPESRMSWHSNTMSMPQQQRRYAMFHGHGVAEADIERKRILRYLQQLDQGVRDLIAGQELPLVIAGVEYVLPIYRQASSYPFLMEQGIAHNPQDLSDEELHQRAWEIVQPRFAKAREEALENYAMLAGRENERAVSDLEDIVMAAYDQRIGTLFLNKSVHAWGTYDPDERTVTLANVSEADGENEKPLEQIDLLDEAALHTLLNDGTIYAMDSADVPASPAAAILRY